MAILSLPLFARPQMRGECAAVARPCPFADCRHSLKGEDSCALDVADRGARTIAETQRALGLSDEGVRLLYRRALASFEENGGDLEGLALLAAETRETTTMTTLTNANKRKQTNGVLPAGLPEGAPRPRRPPQRERAPVKLSPHNSGADISECGRYRHRLWRDWSADGGVCLFVMLNPSTADALQDDPTIRKCVGFAKRWGFGALMVVNLFAFRSTQPRGLLGVDDPVGPDNDVFLREEAETASRIVLAWGSHPELKAMLSTRAFVVRRLLGGHAKKTVVLGRAKDGNPRHPLMLSYDVEPGGWS